jgi:hypothetical protein
MRIHPERQSSAVAADTVRTQRTEPPPAGQDHVVLSGSAQLDSQLQAAPESRADAVARARVLIQDSAYPPPAVVRKISDHLAAKLG